MSWINYHSHSDYCDGIGTLDEYISKAISHNFPAYGFSSHSPVPFDNSWSMHEINLGTYLSHIHRLKEKWKDKIQIYAGLEIDYIPNKVGPNSRIYDNRKLKDCLDYTIGSIHFIDNFSNGKPWEIDGCPNLFQKGLNQIFMNNIEHALTRYYELTRMMVETEPPAIIGHFDKIKMQNPGNLYFCENSKWYQDEVLKTLDLIAKKNIIIEVNTRGLYKKAADIYPSPWILKEIHKLGIPITISSDSHHVDEISGCFKDAARELIDIGFKEVHILFNGQWQAVKFSINGIETSSCQTCQISSTTG